jgi:hypothetical protein
MSLQNLSERNFGWLFGWLVEVGWLVLVNFGWFRLVGFIGFGFGWLVLVSVGWCWFRLVDFGFGCLVLVSLSWFWLVSVFSWFWSRFVGWLVG